MWHLLCRCVDRFGDCLILYTDDFHACDTFNSEASLLQSLTRLGALLDLISDIGLQINLSKTQIILALKGSKQNQILARSLVHPLAWPKWSVVPDSSCEASCLLRYHSQPQTFSRCHCGFPQLQCCAAESLMRTLEWCQLPLLDHQTRFMSPPRPLKSGKRAALTVC